MLSSQKNSAFINLYHDNGSPVLHDPVEDHVVSLFI